ncbi:hypothetical protein [Nocardia sp. XZ_19_369]|uniref:hypothetical protein n=1 Tax=Nocardia sp. XZ_19_369 TaxID=2769487 RepID=UPI00188F702B|nr:hypothetical protein [Nocardia sp. XZ_19_369]
MTVRRIAVRSSVAAAIALGSIVVIAPQAAAETCADGSARIFFSNSEPSCQTGTASYSEQTIAKVCSMAGADVVAEATYLNARKKTVTQRLELSNGRCGRFEIAGQQSATVSVTPN